MVERLDRFWVGLCLALFICAVAGVTAFAIKHHSAPPLAVTTRAEIPPAGNVYIDGAVVNPGLYPLQESDTINDLLGSAGGTDGSADATSIMVYVPRAGERDTSQVIDINRADTWLFQALPGIGPEKAAAIVEYRTKHGPYRMAEDLLEVPGIGDMTLKNIRPYITVGE